MSLSFLPTEIENIILENKTHLEHSEKFLPVLDEIKTIGYRIYPNSSERFYKDSFVNYEYNKKNLTLHLTFINKRHTMLQTNTLL